MQGVAMRHRRCALAAVALLLALGAGVIGAAGLKAAGMVSVRVYERTEVAEDQVLLGRIARIDADDARTLRQLESLVLGRAPLPGKSRTLDGAYITQRLRQGGFDPAALDLQIPAEVVIVRGVLEIGRERIEQIVKGYIQQQAAGKSETVRVKEIRNAEPLALPPGRLDYEVSAPKHAALAGSVPLAIQFKVNDDFEKRIWVTAVLEARTRAVVCKRPLGRFKPIEESDVEVRELDLSELPADFISDPDPVIGKRVRRALDAGTVMRPDLVEFPPAVKRGDRVVIIAESAGLRVTAAGEVKQKGCVGERVPVVNLDSNRVVYARVVDGRTVKIEF
jgi:flagella basal body P-ring formation protein FlgA